SGLERWPNISLEHVAFPGEMHTLRPLVLQREAHRLVDELLQRELERIGAQADPAPVELRPTGEPRSHSPQLAADLLRPRLDLESMRSEQGERDPLHAEAQARRVRLRAARELDAIDRGEVVLVVVEGGHRGRLGAGDLNDHLELELLLALAGREHAPGAPEERVRRDRELGVQPDLAQERGRAVAPHVAPGHDRVGLADAHDLALVEHLHPRGVARGLVAKHVGAARIDGHTARRELATGGDGRVHGVAGGWREHELGHRLELAPVVVPAGAVELLGGLAFAALERKDAAGEMREGLQVADRLEIASRKQRWKAQLLGLLGSAGPCDHVADAPAYLLEVRTAPIQAGHARLDQKASIEQLGEEGRLVGRARAIVGHHTCGCSSASAAVIVVTLSNTLRWSMLSGNSTSKPASSASIRLTVACEVMPAS